MFAFQQLYTVASSVGAGSSAPGTPSPPPNGRTRPNAMIGNGVY